MIVDYIANIPTWPGTMDCIQCHPSAPEVPPALPAVPFSKEPTCELIELGSEVEERNVKSINQIFALYLGLQCFSEIPFSERPPASQPWRTSFPFSKTNPSMLLWATGSGPPKFMCWNPTPCDSTVLGCEAFWKWWGLHLQKWDLCLYMKWLTGTPSPFCSK